MRFTDSEVRIYSDDAAVARWLQRSIETLLFPEFAETGIPVNAAAFERFGDPRGQPPPVRNRVTESFSDHAIALTGAHAVGREELFKDRRNRALRV